MPRASKLVGLVKPWALRRSTELLECLPAGFEAGVGVEEGVEAGPVGFVELVASAQQREPGPEHLGVEGGLGAFRPALDVAAHRGDLRVVRRTLGSTTLDVDQISTGAREQIGVLSRLACAAIVSPDDGGVPVMIDDALGWSDPQRLQTMGAAIKAAGKQCQVIVLTCTPGRYSHVGQAKVVHL